MRRNRLFATILCAMPLPALAADVTITPQNARIEDDVVRLVYKIVNGAGRYIETARFKCLIFDAAGELLGVDEDTAVKLAPRQVDYQKSIVSIENPNHGPLGKIECRLMEVE